MSLAFLARDGADKASVSGNSDDDDEDGNLLDDNCEYIL